MKQKLLRMRHAWYLLAACLTLLIPWGGEMQAAPSPQQTSVRVENVTSLKGLIQEIESQTSYRISYQGNLADNVPVKIAKSTKSVSQLLDEALRGTGITYIIRQNNIILTRAEAQSPASAAPAAPRKQHIAGQVLDAATRQPIIGATIWIKDSALGTSTASDGSFDYSFSGNFGFVTVSYVGYQTQEFPIDRIPKVISLSPDNNLEEVVVVGYGTQKKASIIGSIASVPVNDIKMPTGKISNNLAGQLAGVISVQRSGEPGASSTFWIRGISTFGSNKSPLVLVDGAEGDLMKINPNDVASISVVKDASAAAIYGARAAFGVVLVTTKSGDSSGKTRISYSGRWGWNEPTTSTDYETRGYYSVYLNDLFWRSYAGNNYTRYTEQDMMELWARRNDRTEHPDRPWVKIDQRDGRDTYVYYGNTDWYHYLFKDEHPNTSHSISLSGGNDRVDYLLSGSYYSEEGLFRQHPDKLQKITFRSKITFDINKWLKVSNNTSYYNYKYFYPGPSDVNTAFSWSTVHGLASMMPYNPDGTSVYNTSFSNYQIMDGLPTILNKDGHTNDDHTDNMSTTTELTWTPVKGLEIKGNFTYMFNTTRYTNRQVNTEYSQYPGEINTLTSGKMEDKLYEKSMTHTYYQANLYGTFERTFARDHNFKAMVGFNWETKFLKDVAATGYNLLSETLNDLNLVGQGADGEKRMEVGGGQNEYALMGFFGRLNYDYKGKYLVEASGRYDGTSRFKRGQRWGFFPSFSLGWRVSEEAFFDGIRDQFNNLKLRFSYGQLGNQNVGYYDYIRKISIGSQNYLFGGDKPTTATISAPVASDLSWERSIHKNLGVDMSFLNNRLAFSADFYIRDTKDMLTAGIALPATYGADSPKMNSADLRTKGYELSLNWRDEFQLLRRPFSYSVTLTFNDYVSNITKFDNPDRSFAKKYYEGMRWGEIWGYRIDGLFASDEEARNYPVDQTTVNEIINASAGAEKGLRAGDLKFRDLDGNNVISIGKNTVDDPGDREIIGNSQPRYHYGATLALQWAGIDFSIFFQGIGRQDWYPAANALAFWGPYARPYATYLPKNFHTQIWSEENPNSYFPRPRGYTALQGTNRELTAVNDRYLQNIGYCRLKNLTVGYTLPRQWTRKALIESLRIYFTGENLFTWSGIRSDYIDPEMAATNGNLRLYPWQRTYMFGVDVTF